MSMRKYFKDNIDSWKLFTLEKDYNTNIGEIAYRKVLKEPSVSSFLIENGLKTEYPENSTFAICLSHDIDEIYTPMIHRIHSLAIALSTTKMDNLKDAFRGILDKKKCKYQDFEEIMAIEEKYNARSTFFFLATTVDPFRYRYDIEDIEDRLGKIKDNGFEIGLHGGYFSYDDSKALYEEKKRLEEISGTRIEGFRSHYLNLHVPRTWQHLSKLGFKYDTTLGYRRGSGFINGMCHPFHPYIKEAEKELDLLEIPLIIMDAAYPILDFKVNKYWEEILHIIDIVEKNQGVLTINWHNDSLLSARKSEQGKMYEKILKEGEKRGAWLTNCHEVCKWWNMNFEQFINNLRQT